MIEVQANVAITKVTITLTEVDASRLRTLLQGTILWQEAGVISKLAQDIDTSLGMLDIPASPVRLDYSEQHGMFVERTPK